MLLCTSLGFYWENTSVFLLKQRTNHSDTASEKIPFTGLHVLSKLFIVSMWFILIFLENFRIIDIAFEAKISRGNSQSWGLKHRANSAICRWLKKFKNEINTNEAKMGITSRAEVWRQRSLRPYRFALDQPRDSGSQGTFPDLTESVHLPTAAQNCKYVSCLPRPHLALLAETLVSGAVSGHDCSGLICCWKREDGSDQYTRELPSVIEIS